MRIDLADLEMDTEPSPLCSPVRARTVGVCIGVFDLVFLTAALVKSVQFLQEYGFNFFATASVTAIGLLYSIHVLVTLIAWYGLARELSSWLVPKILLKFSTVIICVGLTLVLTFFVSSNSPVIGNAIARGFNAEYWDHRGVIEMGCVILVGVSAVLSLAQAWLLVLLVNIYRQIRSRELEAMFHKAMRKLDRLEAGRRAATTDAKRAPKKPKCLPSRKNEIAANTNGVNPSGESAFTTFM